MYRPIDQLEEEIKKDELQQAVERNQTRLAEVSQTKTPPAKTPYGNIPQGWTPEAGAAIDAQIKEVEKQDARAWRKSYERGTVLGQVKEFGAFGLDFATNFFTSIPELGANALGYLQTMSVPDEAKQAYARQQAYNEAVADGTLETKIEAIAKGRTQADAALLRGDIDQDKYTELQSKFSNLEKLYTPLTEDEAAILKQTQKGNMYSDATNEERLMRAGGFNAAAEAIDQWQEDTFNFKDEVPTQRLAEEVRAKWNANEESKKLKEAGAKLIDQGNVLDGSALVIEGLWDQLGDIPGVVLDNPQAGIDLTLEVAGEVVAYMKGKGLGKAMATMDSVDGATDSVREGINNFREDYGREPNSDELAAILAGGVLYGAADQLSLRIAADAIKRTGKKLPETPAADAPTLDVTPQNKDMIKAVGERVAAFTGSTAGETGTGFVQGALEETVLQGEYDWNDIDGGNIAANTVLEAIGTAGLSGVKNTLGATKDAVVGTAQAIGSLGGKSVLSQEQNNLPPELKEELQAASESAIETGNLSTVVDDNNNKFDVLTALSTIARRNAKDGVDQTEKDNNVQQAYAILDRVASDHQAIEDEYFALQESGLKDKDTRARVTNLQKQLTVSQQRLDEAADLVMHINALTTAPTQDDIASLKTSVVDATETTEETVANGDKLIALAQRSPQMLPSDEARKLANSAGLDQTQRDYLTAFADAQDAIDNAKGTDAVAKDIFVGGEGFRGIDQYRSTLPALLAVGKTNSAVELVQQLKKFAEGKIERAADFNNTLDVLLDPESTPAQKEAAKAAFDSKGYTTLKGQPAFISTSRKGVQMIRAQQLEAEVLRTALAESTALLTDALRKGRIDQTVIEQTGLKPAADATVSAPVEDTPPWDETPVAATTATAQPRVQSTPTEPAATAPEMDVPASALDNTPELSMDEYDQMGNQEVAATTPVAPKAEPRISVQADASPGYRERTQRNAATGDVTIAYAADHNSPGERLTQKSVNAAGKPLVTNQGKSISDFAAATVEALKATGGTVLNVAGNSMQTWAKVGMSQDEVNADMYRFLKQVKEQYPNLTRVISGGQTGTDIAGLVAAKALGLDVEAYMPKGFKIRTAEGKDITTSPKAVEKYITDAAQKVLEADQVVQEDSPPWDDGSPEESDTAPETTAATNVPEAEVSQADIAPTTEIPAKKTGSIVLSAKNLATGLIDSIARKLGKESPLVERGSKNSAPGILQNVDFYDFFADVPEGDPLRTLFDLHDKELAPLFDQMFDPNHEYLQFLADENGNVDENIKAAFSIAAFNWLTTNGSRTLLNDDKSINKILRRRDDAYVPKALREFMIDKGSYPQVIAEALGRDIVRTIGIKFSEDQPSNYQPNLEMAVGGLLLNMLAGAQYVVVDKSTGADIISRLPAREQDDYPLDPQANLRWVKMTPGSFMKKSRDPERFRPAAKIKTLISANKASADKGMSVADLFGATRLETKPTFEPVQEVVQTMRGTTQRIPERMREGIAKAQSRGFTLKADMGAILDKLGERNTLEVFGYNHDALNTTHVDRLGSEESRNNAIEKSLEKYLELRAQGGESRPFYFKFFMARQGRLHIESNGFQPQGDKSHRFLYTTDAWNSTVSTDRNDISNIRFRKSVAQAFGIKDDQLTDEDAAAQLDAMIAAKPEIEAAAKAALALSTGKGTDTDVNLLMAGLNATDMSTHALAALLAYGKMLAADGDTFVSDLPYEIDGKTNGVAIAMIQFAGWAKGIPGQANRIMRKFGFFTDGTDSYGEWFKDPNALDAYQEMAVEWNHQLEDDVMTESLEERALSAQMGSPERKPNRKRADTLRKRIRQFPLLKELIGEFVGEDENGNLIVKSAGRNLSKPPTMTTIYGAGARAVGANIGDSVLDLFYGKLEKAVKAKDFNTLADLSDMADQLMLNGKSNNLGWVVNQYDPVTNTTTRVISLDKVLKNPVPSAFITELQAATSDTYGYAVKGAVAGQYGNFQMVRDEFNQLINMININFITEYRFQVQQAINAITDPQSPKYNPDFDPAKDQLPRSVLNEIEKLLTPMMPILKQPMAGDNENAPFGLLLGSKDKVRGTGEGNLVRMPTSAKTKVVNHSGAMSDNLPVNYYSQNEEWTADLGVAAAILSIHNLDAASAMEALIEHNILSVFDGFVGGSNQIVNVGKTLNQRFWEDSAGESLMEKAFTKYKAALVHEAWIMKQDGRLDNKRYKEYLNSIKEMVNYDVEEIRRERAEYLKDVTTVLQFNYEGAGYKPKANEAVSSEPEQIVQEIAEAVEAEAKTSKWGKLGESLWHKYYPVERAAANLFKDREVVSAAEMLQTLRKSLGAKNRKAYPQALATLIPMMEKVLTNSDVKVQLLNADTVFDDPETEPLNSWGEYAAYWSPKNQTVYVKAEAFETHGLNAATILHELVHASVNKVIFSDNRTPEQQAAVDQLQALMDYTKARIGDDHPAFADLGEFVAWGMTDYQFQKQLLNMSLDESFGGKIRRAFDAFVNAIAQALGMSSNEETVLAQLLAATPGLFDQDDETEFVLRPQLSPQQAPIEFSNLELFDDLARVDGATVDASEQTRLRDIVAKFTSRIPQFNTYRAAAAQGIEDVTDQYLMAIRDNRIPFVSRLRATGIRLTKQELFVAEQIEAITRGGLATKPRLHKELRQLFRKAKAQLPLSAFADDPTLDLRLPANRAARDAAMARRDEVFKIYSTERTTSASETSTTGTTEAIQSDYLARFLALAQTHKPFRDALLKLSPEPMLDLKADNLSAQLDRFFNKVMDALAYIMRLPSRAPSMQARLDEMFLELADVRVRNQSNAMLESNKRLSQFEGVANGLVLAVREQMLKAARSDVIRNAKYGLVRAAGATVTTLTNGTVEEHIEALENALEPYRKGKQGILGNLATEFKGMTTGNVKWYEMLRVAKHRIDQARKHVESYTTKAVNSAFGRELEKAEREALTKILIKGDLQALTDKYSLAEIADLLTNETKLDAEIQKMRNRLRIAGPLSMRMRQDARNLGFMMATGKASEGQLLNAHNIARQYGRNKFVNQESQQMVEPVIDVLASLWAIHYSHPGNKRMVADLIREESARPDGQNGIEFVLNSHRALIQMSKRDLFDDNPALMMKGYTKDTTDPHVTVRVVFDEGDIELQRRGYTKVRDLGRDPSDLFSQTAKLMVSESDSLNTHVTGILSLTSRKARGSHVEWMSRNEVTRIQKNKLARLNMNPTVETDPALDRTVYMVPVVRPDGAVVNFRYMMNEADRDSLLRRDNDIAKVMGVYAASIVDKNESVSVNSQTVTLLKENFDANSTQLGKFIKIGAEAQDPALKEAWDLLPDETKRAAREAFGGNFIYIPRDMENMVLGYRKVGMLTDMWDIPEEHRTALQQMMIDALEAMLGIKALSRIRKTGEIVEELVRGAKDIIVVRSGITLLGNIVSNFSVLWLGGVNPLEMAELHREGYNGIVTYQKDSEELGILRQQLMGNRNLSRAKRNEMEERIAELEDALAVNPVRELVEAGAFPTIIEDIDDMPEDFSYRNRLENWLEEKTASVPQPIKTAANWAVLSKKTAAYKLLNHSTQVSDFVARYVMYKHLTERRAEPMARRDAVNRVMEVFIPYDVPTDKYIQWANDKGLALFTKYFIRVQKVILMLIRENPARALSLMAVNQVVDFWNILDSIISLSGLWYRLSNPLALVTETPDDILTFQVANELM